MIKAIIVDDEPKNIRTLNHLLMDLCPQVQVQAISDNADEAKKLIEGLQPDLVFLDIEMPYGSGFDLLRSIPEIDFEVIFVTAFNQYAIDAFRYAAVDYVLKPIEKARLTDAVKRAEEKIVNRQSAQNYELLLKNLEEQNAANQKIILNEVGKQHVIPLGEIMYCIADGAYTRIHTTKRVFVSARNLKEFAQMLPAVAFYRIHHGHIVNVNFIENLEKTSGNIVKMRDGKELEIAVRRKDEFMNIFLR